MSKNLIASILVSLFFNSFASGLVVATDNPSDVSAETIPKQNVDLKFISISPVDRIQIGSPKTETYRDKDEGPFFAKITKSYEILETAVTQLQWFRLMGNNPSHFKNKEDCPDDFMELAGGLCPSFPVEKVSYFDALSFMEKLNKNDPKHHYRLPTEVEWENATRAGTKGMYGFIKEEVQINSLDDKIQCPAMESESSKSTTVRECLWKYGLFSKNSKTQHHPRGQSQSVTSKKPNQWGIYGMSGGVWEWIHDRYGDYPTAPLTVDYKGPSNGPSVVLRGGSWDSLAKNLRSAYRNAHGPDNHHSDIGFRVVRVLKTK